MHTVITFHNCQSNNFSVVSLFIIMELSAASYSEGRNFEPRMEAA
jgi:hypothetical protein